DEVDSIQALGRLLHGGAYERLMPRRLRGEARSDVDGRPNVTALAIEHPSAMDTAADSWELGLRRGTHFDVERAAIRRVRFAEYRHERTADSFDDSPFPPGGGLSHKFGEALDHLSRSRVAHALRHWREARQIREHNRESELGRG